jgi:hypothetical protein
LIQPPKHDGRIGSQGLPPSPDHPREKGNAYFSRLATHPRHDRVQDGKGDGLLVSPEYLDGLFRVAGREHGIPDFHQEEPRESVTSGPEIALRER